MGEKIMSTRFLPCGRALRQEGDANQSQQGRRRTHGGEAAVVRPRGQRQALVRLGAQSGLVGCHRRNRQRLSHERSAGRDSVGAAMSSAFLNMIRELGFLASCERFRSFLDGLPQPNDFL